MKQICLGIGLISLIALLSSCGMGTTPPPPSGEAQAFAYNVGGKLDIIQPAQPIAFTVHINSPAGVTAQSFTLTRSLNGGEPSLIGTFTSWPQTFTFSLEDLLLGWEAVEFSDLRKNDVLSIGISISEDLNTPQQVLEFPLGCISDLAGEYSGITIGKSGPGGGGVYDTIRYAVSLTDLEDGRYEISELTGGMYPTIWGGAEERGILIDSCQVILIPGQKDQWDDQIQGKGLIQEDGSILYEWTNGYGDRGTTILNRG